jgi:prevent-host-death family protein
MVSYAISEARANFAEVVKEAQNGVVAITSGKKREIVVYMISAKDWEPEKRKKRVGGKLAHWNITFDEDWSMTDEEFLGLPEGALDHLVVGD